MKSNFAAISGAGSFYDPRGNRASVIAVVEQAHRLPFESWAGGAPALQNSRAARSTLARLRVRRGRGPDRSNYPRLE